VLVYKITKKPPPLPITTHGVKLINFIVDSFQNSRKAVMPLYQYLCGNRKTDPSGPQPLSSTPHLSSRMNELTLITIEQRREII
jgi:hypothetical protein